MMPAPHSMSRPPTIALVEWNWIGHHENFFRQFLRSLNQLGATVVPVMSKPELLAHANARQPAGTCPPIEPTIMPPVEFCPSPMWSFQSARVSGTLRALANFRRLSVALGRWERGHGRKIDLVFFACMYDWDFPRASVVSLALRRRWAGLYLQGRAFHRLGRQNAAGRLMLARAKFRSSRLVGLGVLEPAMVRLAEQATPNLPVRIFPDIPDSTAGGDSEAAERFRETMVAKAGGRPIVSLLGFLQPSKGIELFLRAACDQRLEGVAFFLGGTLDRNCFSSEQLARIARLMAQAPNLHLSLDRLDNECFNAAIRASDILFAVYLDFPYSSNIQVRAAQASRPTIVTDGTLMAERSRTYRLGECIPENDLDSLVAAIGRILLASRIASGDGEAERLRAQFVSEHDEAATRRAMEWVIQLTGLPQELLRPSGK